MEIIKFYTLGSFLYDSFFIIWDVIHFTLITYI